MTFEELLDRDGFLIYKTRGVSMEPMLRQNRDLVTIRKKDPAVRCRENDVVLYYRKSDRQYTLHRIVAVRKDDYVIIGDNCISYEYGIKDEDILGVLVSFKRRGKSISVDDPEYLDYVRKTRAGEKRRIAAARLRIKLKSAAMRAPFYSKLRNFVKKRD